MKDKTAPNSMILTGKMKDVLDYLKSCEKNYVYVKDLIIDIDKIGKKSNSEMLN